MSIRVAVWNQSLRARGVVSRVLAPARLWGLVAALGAIASPVHAEQPQAPAESAPAESAPADSAPAQSAKPSLAEARQAFLEARRLEAQGEFRAAADKYEYALRARQTAGLHYYAGFGREQAGDLLVAREHYRRALGLLAQKPDAALEPLVQEASERIEAALARVKLLGVPRDAEVLVDDRSVSEREQVVLEPGQHRLEIRAEGFLRWERTISLERGATRVVRVQLQPQLPEETAYRPSASAANSEPEEREGASLRAPAIVFWSGTAAAVAGAATGVLGVVTMQSDQESVEQAGARVDGLSDDSGGACRDPSVQQLQSACRDLDAAVSQRETSRTVYIVGFGVAGVGLATAVTSYLLFPDAPFRLSGGGSETGGWVSLSGRF